MNDAELVAFLEWALPRMGLRWIGFKNFRGTIRKRIGRRLGELGLAPDLAGYRARLEVDPNEWSVLDEMCRITISRLYRDHDVMDVLKGEILPRAAERARPEGRSVRIWSAGCASGEEPYTIALLWQLAVAPRHPGVAISILASDVDAALVERARRGAYEEGSLREVPAVLRDLGLRRENEAFVVNDLLRRDITFEVRDIRKDMPEGPFDIVLCRNVAFTYFAEDVQREVGARLVARIVDEGALVVGAKETIAHADQLPIVASASTRGIWIRCRRAP
jgi:chemotaxis protein methyltransferase CheR